MKRLNYIFILIVVISTLISGCSSSEVPNEPPEISITIGDNDIEYIIGKNKWDNAIYDREDTFHTMLKGESVIEIPFIEIGETAKIDFMNYTPDDLILYDILINENGEQIYTDREVTTVPIEMNNGVGSFEIKKHMASYLSSTYVEGKTDIRGFRIIATWGKNECEYGFIIRTGNSDKTESALNLTLNKIIELSSKGEELSWQDFESYNGMEVGSGLYIKSYNIDDNYNLLIGGPSLDEKPMYIYLVNKKTDERIDIRFDDIEEFTKIK